MSIYVGNLSYEVTQNDIQDVFAEYGTVSNVHVPKDRETGKMRGFSFLGVGDDAEEVKAIKKLDGGEWMGKTLTVYNCHSTNGCHSNSS